MYVTYLFVPLFLFPVGLLCGFVLIDVSVNVPEVKIG